MFDQSLRLKILFTIFSVIIINFHVYCLLLLKREFFFFAKEQLKEIVTSFFGILG